MTVEQESRTASAPRRIGESDRPTVPVLAARPGGTPSASPPPSAIATPPSSSRCAARRPSGAARGASILLGPLVVHVLISGSGLGLGGTDESFNETLADHRTGTLTTFAEVGSQVGSATVLPILVGLIAIACAAHPPLAHRGVRGLRAARRVGHLPRHDVRGSPRPPVRPPPGRSAGQRQLSLGPHRRRRSRSTPASCCCSRTRFTSSLSKALAWTCAILLTTFVAFSRMYRGHAPSARRRRRRARRHRGDPGGAVRLPRGRRGRGEAGAA